MDQNLLAAPMDGQVRSRRRSRAVAAGMLYAASVLCYRGVSAFQTPESRASVLLHRRTAGQRQGGALFSSPPPRPPSSRPFVDVALDRPLIDPTLYTQAGKASGLFKPVLWGKTIWTLIANNSVKVAIVAFCTALLLTLLSMRSSSSTSATASNTVEQAGMLQRSIGKVQRAVESVRSKVDDEGTLMSFDENDNDGWGVATLKAKRRVGKSTFVQYDFDLPQPDYVLPLDMGQQVSVCCLDNDGNMARGDFFPYSPTAKKLGSFSIMVPNRSHEANTAALGIDGANFCRVLKQDVKVGDEVAIRPGTKRLNYRGQYLPVTDMVFICGGNGVTPVLDQVRTVLPSSSGSSVQSVTVVWINEEAKEFDVNAELLEKEYNKFSSKLAVACIVHDVRTMSLGQSREVGQVVPKFKPGTMAVLSGPNQLKNQALEYLEAQRGYPRDTICLL